MYKLLIVDDEQSIRNSLVNYFEDCGYETYTAESAEAAKEIIQNNEFDVAILDLRLPGKSGDELILDVYSKTKKTIFIIYSGSTNYIMPNEIRELERVSETIYHKPLADLAILNNAIVNMLKKSNK
jgi:DNA-binding NtrC family response regulator